MENEEFKEIMEALKELSIEQAVIKERVESHLKKVEKGEEEQDDLIKMVSRHDMFMKASIWFYGLVLSIFSYKFFGSH